MKIHPAAEIFPLMTGAEFDALVQDIKENGLREPIVLHEGEVLDGRNRLRACEQLGKKPKFTEWNGVGTAHSYVVSKNLHRRHLNESQRAMIAARLAVNPRGTNQHSVIATSSRQEAGELMNVHPVTVSHAKKVLTEGTPEEIEAVDKGEAAVTTIAKQIRAKCSPERREKKRSEPLSQSGRNPERIQRQQINAEIWGRIRDTLTHLTSLPHPSDVAAVARAHDKTGLIDARLAQSLQWLKDFEHEWSNRDEAAA